MEAAQGGGPARCYFSPRESQFLKSMVTKHGSNYAVSTFVMLQLLATYIKQSLVMLRVLSNKLDLSFAFHIP